MRYFFRAHTISHDFANAMAGSSSVFIVVIFTLWSGAERSFGGVNEAEASRGGSGLGKWLGDHKGAARSRITIIYRNRNDVIFEGYNILEAVVVEHDMHEKEAEWEKV